MKLKDAIQKRIPRIRKSIWANPEAYIRLPLLKDNLVGPWAELYDEPGQRALGMTPGSQRLPVFLAEIAEDDGYEEYTGAVSLYELENFAKAYTEF